VSRAPTHSAERLLRLLASRGPVRPTLDFERAGRAHGSVGVLLLCAGLLACLAVGMRLKWLNQDLTLLEPAALSKPVITASRPGGAIGGSANRTMSKLTTQRAEQVNAVIARLAMPWNDWFLQLESAAKGKVVLASLQPEADGRRVRISGEAKRFEDLVDYMMQLEASPGFANVFLSEHAEPPPGATSLSFSLSADWVGGP
jgi:hypothetical protein